MKRCCGILLAVSSLPGSQGIGDFGRYAYDFIDALASSHIKIWQILPLHPLVEGNSPYQTRSMYALDEIYINLDRLAECGFVSQSSIRNFNKFKDFVAYDEVRSFKEPYFKKAFRYFKKHYEEFSFSFQAFCECCFWLEDYAVFQVLQKEKQPLWDVKKQLERFKKKHQDAILYEKFLQFVAYMQWDDILMYANEKQVQIMGDIPFYVAYESADVWRHPEYFKLDEQKRPLVYAGVEPDTFAKQGQCWNMPVYDWEALKKQRYDFWIKRLAFAQKHYHILRLDHFRGFDTYYEISCKDTQKGQWKLGPSYDFFHEVSKALPTLSLVVEDLGNLRKEVYELKSHYDFCGMWIMQSNMSVEALQKGIPKYVVAYTGTHDYPTFVTFYRSMKPSQREQLRHFLIRQGYQESRFYEKVLHFMMDSNADVCMFPIQDLLGLNQKARMNTPGTSGSPNWEWKLKNLKEIQDALSMVAQWVITSQRN